MWVLVGNKGRNEDVPPFTRLVADDEPTVGELAEKRLRVAIVIGQNLGLKACWPILEATFPIGLEP
jgi:hypothetical protein